jgi:HSP20 family molecular chaperone IbpA
MNARTRPFRSVVRPDDPFEDLFREFFRAAENGVGPLEPAAEVAESDGEVIVKLETPGR